MPDRYTRESFRDAGFEQKPVKLRDGRAAIVWVDSRTGHGVLDPEFWERPDDFYSSAYREESSATPGRKMAPAEHEAIYRQSDRRNFDLFSDRLTADARFLEIGASYGGIIAQVLASGVNDCSVVEPNAEDVEYLKGRFSGLTIYPSLFEDADFGNQTFDLVVSIEVLEHVPDPDRFLEKLSTVLEPTSRVVFTVPNHRDILKDIYRIPEYGDFYYHKAHIHYFTMESLADLFARHGFKGDVTVFSMYPFFNNVWWYQNRKPQPSAKLALDSPTPGDESSAPGRLLNAFYKQVEAHYARFLTENQIGDHLMYSGSLG